MSVELDPVLERALKAEAQLAKVIAQRDEFIQSERKLSDSYLRIRGLLKAFDTPHAPTDEQVYEHTEKRLRRLISERDDVLDRSRKLSEALGGAHEIQDSLYKQRNNLADLLKRAEHHIDDCLFKMEIRNALSAVDGGGK